MKKILLLLPLAILLSGCTSIPAALEALGKDKNNVSVQLTTIYGNLRYARSGATNAAVAADGAITPK